MNTPVTGQPTPPQATPMPFPRVAPPVPQVSTVTTVTSTPPMPAAPLYPPSSTVTSTTVTTSGGSSSSNSSSGPVKQTPQKKSPIKLIVAAILFLLLVIGGGVAFYLSQRQQDTRNQAAGETLTCGNTCATDAECTAVQQCVSGKCALKSCMNYPADVRAGYCAADNCSLIQTGLPLSTNPAACSLTFSAAENPAPTLACAKMAYQDEFTNTAGNYAYTTTKSSFEPGDVIVFKVDVTRNAEQTQTITLTDLLKQGTATGDIMPGLNMDKVDFMDSSCGANAYNATSQTLTCSVDASDAVLSKSIGFRVKVKTNITSPYVLNNTAKVTAGALSATCQTNVNLVPLTAQLCGGACTATSQCPQLHSCNGGTCKLDACLVSGTACTANKCAVNSCGSACTTSAECPGNHTCSAGVCKLTACLATGATCNTTQCAVVTPTPVPTPTPLVCGSACTTGGAACPTDHTCSNNVCVLTACTASGASCTANKCQVTGCGNTCATNADCPTDHTCSSGVCKLSACLVTGATCNSTQCQVVTPTPVPTPIPTPIPTPAPIVCGSTCTSTGQCPSDHTCNGGVCQLTACVNGAACSANKCQTNACGSTCTASAQCPNDHTCSNGICRLTTCLNGSSCSSDQCRTTTCGSSCSTTAECPGDHTCSSGVCRLTVCVNGTQSCTNNQCTVVTTIAAVPSPSPAVGCNQTCVTNSDCQSASHICVDTASGRRCRLESNIASDGCYPATQTVAVVNPTPRPSLPVSGSSDILKALGVGAFALILGAVGVMFM